MIHLPKSILKFLFSNMFLKTVHKEYSNKNSRHRTNYSKSGITELLPTRPLKNAPFYLIPQPLYINPTALSKRKNAKSTFKHTNIPTLNYLLEHVSTSNNPQQLIQEVLCSARGAEAIKGCISIQSISIN